MKRVLLVDDKPESLQLLRALLAGHGYAVERVGSEGEALVKAHRDLVEREAHLRALLDTEPDCVKLLDARGRILEVNAPGLRMLGAQRLEEVVGREFMPLLVEADREPFSELLRRVFGGESGALQFRCDLPASGLRWMQTHAAPLRDAAGRVVALLGITRDITAQQAAEARLAASERRFRGMIERGSDAIVLMDAQGRIFYRTAVGARIFGHSDDAVLGHTFAEFLHPEELPAIAERFGRLLRTPGDSFFVEFRYRRPDGHWGYADGAATNWLEDPDIGAVVVNAREITARKRVESRVEHLSRLYATLSQVNQAIIRAKTREELFAAICRAAVAHGRFAVAWIGLLDAATRVVAGVAADAPGADAGRLAALRFDLGDRDVKGGLMGRALVSGRLALSGDIRNDATLGHVHAVATEFGLRAAAAVPFSFQGQVAGFLVLAAAEVDFFADADLQNLVGEMATDISYALDAMQADAQRRQAEAEAESTRALLRAAVGASPAGMLVAEAPDVRIVLANDAAMGIRGGERTDLTHIAMELHSQRWQTFHLDGTPYDSADLPLSRAVLRGEKVRDEEVIIRNTAGEARRVLASAAPVHDAAGRVVAGVVIFPDITELRRAEESLGNLAHAVNAAGDVVFLTDPRGLITQVNEQFTRLYGYAAAEVVGQVTPRILKSGRHAPEFYAEVWRRLLAGGVVQGEIVNRAKDGRVVEIEETITSFRDDRGELAGFLAVQREMGARKRAERRSAAFAELGYRLNTVRTAREAAEVIVNTADVLLGWEACLVYLYVPERDRVRPVLAMDLVEGERRDCTTAAGEYPVGHYSRRALQEGAILTLRQEPLAKPEGNDTGGGSERPAASLMHVLLREQKRIIGLLSIQSYRLNAYTEADLATLQSLADHCAGALRRIDEEESRRRAEAALRESEVRFRKLIEHSSDLITVIDPAGIVRFQSPSSERLLGYPPEALAGRPAFERIHPDDAPQVTASIRRALTRPGQPASVTYRFRHRDGAWHTLESIGRSVVEGGGEPVIIVNSRDVTEHRLLEEQLRQSQKMDAIGQLAGGVAHDFNNILATVLLHTELMAADGGLPAEMLEGLQQIRAAAERATHLTRQLLLFSRKQVMQPRDLDINESVAGFAKMLQRIIGEDVRLELHLAAQPLWTRADPGMLDQVLMNLAVNARDAMPRGGRLRIETTARVVDDTPAAWPADALPGRYVCARVSDTGCGIAPDVLPNIFEPFFTTKEPGKGTGLGLATVFGIVKQHGGWIEVESEPGRGASFQIHLPALVGKAAPAAREEARPAPRGGAETILLVEDDPAVRRVLCATLELHGYRVVTASSGAAALRAWPSVREEVALVLTDLVMPDGVSGHELARQLRAEGEALKIIYMSGYSADLAGRELTLRAGENFLQKPFARHALLETVRRCLDAP